jgi:antitoxin (DNA-binding transcriptional repressor) of toxin-antitoxin stability system
MKTITITEAKRSLGRYLKQAAAGEDIGIVSGADIISLRKVEVISADRLAASVAREAFFGETTGPNFPLSMAAYARWMARSITTNTFTMSQRIQTRLCGDGGFDSPEQF